MFGLGTTPPSYINPWLSIDMGGMVVTVHGYRTVVGCLSMHGYGKVDDLPLSSEVKNCNCIEEIEELSMYT